MSCIASVMVLNSGQRVDRPGQMDREQYKRANAANARPLTLVRPAETLARD